MSEDLVEGKKAPVKRRIALRSSSKSKSSDADNVSNEKKEEKNDEFMLSETQDVRDTDVKDIFDTFDSTQSLFDIEQNEIKSSNRIDDNDSSDNFSSAIDIDNTNNIDNAYSGSENVENNIENNIKSNEENDIKTPAAQMFENIAETENPSEKEERTTRFSRTRQNSYSYNNYGNSYNKRTRSYGQKPYYNSSYSQSLQPQGQAESQALQDNDEIRQDAPVMYVNDYNIKSIYELREKAVEMGVDKDAVLEMKKQEIVTAILKQHAFTGGVIHASGTLEILQDGYGFLRSELNSYLQGPEDVFVSPQIIKANGLKTGDSVYCMLRNPKASERFFAVFKVIKVNGEDPSKAKGRIPFDSLTPLYPNSLIDLEGKKKDLSMRVINMFSPIGRGQRALITAPPRTGKTIILQKIANAITDNYPEIKLMVLLVDERPEEVTDMRRNVKGEVVASTFDEQASRHVNVAEMVIEKAKRYVEYGHDVVILLDSITRLARAYNQTAPASGKVLSGGVDSNALHKPKRFFGAARNIENGGSLTIIATALIETGSRMDEVIFEEFKGTGNCEIVLDRKMAENRVYPAINLKKSGTRHEELLIENDKLQQIWLMRNAFSDMGDVELSEFLLEKMKKSDNDDMFLKSMRTG